MRNFGETRGGVGENAVLENKSGNIYEMWKDGGKVTMDGLLPNALSNGTVLDPVWPPLPRDWGFAT